MESTRKMGINVSTLGSGIRDDANKMIYLASNYLDNYFLLLHASCARLHTLLR
jgi:hypothetical protein